jgi:hypothetical protein
MKTKNMIMKKKKITYKWANFLLGLKGDNYEEIRSHMESQDKYLWDRNDSNNLHEMHKILVGINTIVRNINVYYPSEKAEQIQTAIHISTDNLYHSIGVQRSPNKNNRQVCMNVFLKYSGLVCGSIETLAPKSKKATNILIECNTMLMGLTKMTQAIFKQMEK